MPPKNSKKTGTLLTLVFALGAAGYSYYSINTGTGFVAAGLIKVGWQGRVSTTASGNPDGFKGSDEELQAAGSGAPGN